MDKLEPNHGLSFNNDLSFLSQFSSGLEYCEYEQQIDLSTNFIRVKKPRSAILLKIKQIFTAWKKEIGNYNCNLFKYQENQLLEKSQWILKKLSTETAWVSSLLALTSIGIVTEIASIRSEVNQNLSLKLPLLKNAIRWQRSKARLFPLLEMSEIDSILFGRDDADNWHNKKLNTINDENHNLEITSPITLPVNQQKWLMYPTKINGSLMAIPPLQNQPSVAGFSSFLSTLDMTNSSQESNLTQLDLFNQHKLPYSPLDSVTYHLDDKLMATPKAVYTPYLPKVKF